MSLLSRLFGDANAKEVSRYHGTVAAVAALEAELEKSSDQQLRERSLRLKKTVSELAEQSLSGSNAIDDAVEQGKRRKAAINELLEPHLPEAFALVREAAKRTLGLRHYDVQIIGGTVLHQGQIAEMQTGEGKTLVATLPLYLNALTGLGAHLVTVNDYLARRDAGWMGNIYNFLGMSVGVIGPDFSFIYDPSQTNDQPDWRLQHLRSATRREAYQADITYGTNNEFGFDYLRDNMVAAAAEMKQRPHVFAIVDEVDSILIDEARTPLIISAPSNESADLYQQFAGLVGKLASGTDYTIDEKAKRASLQESGIKKLETLLGVANMYDPGNVRLVHHADVALRAHSIYRKNKDYVVKGGEVIIIDEFTGRMLHGRRYNGGLHQAIEAKEGVAVREESVTLATITFQNYFRQYWKLSGMTGTATTEAEEFSKIYHLEVVSVPTNRPSQRLDLADDIYKTEEAKFKAVVSLVKERQEIGQPVLIGTASIAKSEKLARLLKAANIAHSVLNAKLHQKEGEVVAQAGAPGAVTVATNMAGRGVDIVLGGAPPQLDEPKAAFTTWEKRHQQVLELGGLYVIGTERHESRRIDNQLRGRSGRQGDPGASRFFVSMEDDLMRIFGGDRMKAIMERLHIPDDMSINNKLLSRAIEQAQGKVETHNFDTRKQLVEYDDVMNKHRQAIYRRRLAAVQVESPEQRQAIHQEIINFLADEQRAPYQQKSGQWTDELRAQVERTVTLRAIDLLWVEHLKNLEDLRDSTGLRGYGQRDPLVEYKQEAYRLFNQLNATINQQIADMLERVEVQANQPAQSPAAPQQRQVTNRDQSDHSADPKSKVGRNDPCPCGAVDPATGKVYKYKKCGLVNAPQHRG
ncbi:MAG: preprotein translocase subunit SecA [Patescibacteria group bacterium]